MPPVRGRHVGIVRDPAEVRRQAELAVEDRAGELTARDHDALLAQARAHRVHGPQLGADLVRQVDPGLRLVDARIGLVGGRLGRRAGVIDLPRARDAVGRVLAEQVVQDRRAGTAHADHDDRRRDVRLADLRVAAMPVGHLQPIRQVPEHGHRRDRLADLVETRLVCQPVDETVEPEAERVGAEVVEARLLARGLDELLGRQTRRHRRIVRGRAGQLPVIVPRLRPPSP